MFLLKNEKRIHAELNAMIINRLKHPPKVLNFLVSIIILDNS